MCNKIYNAKLGQFDKTELRIQRNYEYSIQKNEGMEKLFQVLTISTVKCM